MKSVTTILLIAVLANWPGPNCFAACPSMDITGDCRVSFGDFAVLADGWPADYDSDDLAAMALEWLMEGIPADPKVMVWVTISDPGVAGHEGFTGQMSKYEITNAQFCAYLNAALASGDIWASSNYVYGLNGSNSGTDFPGTWYYNLAGTGNTSGGATNGGAARIIYSDDVFNVASGFENHPVTYVSWYGATAFCNYYGYKLPTEWEWQAVADFDGSYIYGCGTSINNSMANYYDSTHPDGTTAVGTFGTYGYGMCDMAGNAYEWTSSVYSVDYRSNRGGGWYFGDSACTVSRQGISDPYTMTYGCGFRVCR